MEWARLDWAKRDGADSKPSELNTNTIRSDSPVSACELVKVWDLGSPPFSNLFFSNPLSLFVQL